MAYTDNSFSNDGNFKILKKKFDGKTIPGFIYAFMQLAITGRQKLGLGEEVNSYQVADRYIDLVMSDEDYKKKLKESGETKELDVIEAAESIMDLPWWKCYKDFYHIFNCGVEMGFGNGRLKALYKKLKII